MTDSAPNQTGSAAARNGEPPALDQAFAVTWVVAGGTVPPEHTIGEAPELGSAEVRVMRRGA